MDAHDEPRRDPRRLVPPPVHRRAARPQLGPPGRPRRARGDPPVLVRPRRRRHPHRLRGAARQGPGDARGPGGPGAGRAPDPRPRRAPRHLPLAGARSPTRYPGERVLVGEVWLQDVERFARYLRPDELHTAFNFDFMARPWDAASLRASIDATLASHAPVGAPATWVLSNHDVTRPVTRYGRAGLLVRLRPQAVRDAHRPRARARRARAAALLAAALPGSLYVYQGDELGLDEVDVPPERDPGPDALPLRRRRPRPRRLPRPAALGGTARAVRLQPGGRRRGAVAQPARALGRADRRGAGRRAGIDAQPVPGGAPGPAAEPGLGRRASVARRPSPTSSPSPAAAGFVCITNLSSAALALPPDRTVLLASADLAMVTFRPTRPPGCARTRCTARPSEEGACRRDERAPRRLTGPTRRSPAAGKGNPSWNGSREEQRCGPRSDAERRSWRPSPSSPPSSPPAARTPHRGAATARRPPRAPARPRPRARPPSRSR